MPSTNRINHPIVIQRTAIHLLLAERSVQAPAVAILQLSPRPRVVIEFELKSDESEASNEMRCQQVIQIRWDQGPTIDVLVGDNWHLGGGKISNILIPIEQPITVFNDNTKINKCKFSLINFPSIWGKQDIKYTKEINGKPHNFVTQHLKLRAHPWSTKITAVDSLMSLDYKLKREGGSAITHFGSVTQSNGQDFCPKELELFLKALHLFLSFARGSYCGLALLSAQDSNRKRVWQQWGTYKTEPWKRDLATWVCGLQSEMLSTVFEGFWKRFNEQIFHDTISKAIHWYLRSNESSEPEVSIILTQAALERLTFATVGEKSQKEGDWIASALNTMEIDPQVPEHCEELVGLKEEFKWCHGPHALVDVRNDLIHPENRHGAISPEAYLETWDLGQRYIELMLLKLFDHTGQYLNRLRRGQGYQSEVEDVPWASAREAYLASS